MRFDDNYSYEDQHRQKSFMLSLVQSARHLFVFTALALATDLVTPSAHAQIASKGFPETDSPRKATFYLTGAAGGNAPTARSSSGELGTFREYSNPGLALELGAGCDFNGVRLELTYALDDSYLKGYDSVSNVYFDYSSGGRTRKHSAFLSGYWDVVANKRWTPYLGAGIGYSHLSIDSFAEPGLSYIGTSRSLLGYQLKAGLALDVSNRSKMFAEAVYRGTSGYTSNDGYAYWSAGSFASWGGQLGVRFAL